MKNSLPEWCEAEEWCPITITAELLGRKWHPIIIHRLISGGKGFNELKEQANGISAKVLSESLEDLQNKEIVEKKILNKKPKKVEYRLTEKGESLESVIMAMKNWGEKRSNQKAML